jgi:GTPase SAR1 family protein
METVFENTNKNFNTINFILVGEEGVGKSSLINTLIKEDKAPISDMHTKTWKLSKYSVKINNLYLNFFDIPGIEGKYADEIIAAELKGLFFDIIICCLDGTRIRPNGMVRKSIAFIRKYIPNVPVLFVVTKENIILENQINRINEVKNSVRENANHYFRHFGLVSVGNYIPFTKTHPFWGELITCIPDFEETIIDNFNKYQFDENHVSDEIQEYITHNYKTISEIELKMKTKEQHIKNMRLIFGIFAYLYVTLCTVVLITGIECYEFHIAQFLALIYIMFLVLLKIIIWSYSTNYFGLFPIYVEEVETNSGLFTGTINFVSKDKYYTKLDGIVSIDGTVYNINTNNSVCCMFELCDNKFFDKYAAVADV